jgi:hypothetical protein
VPISTEADSNKDEASTDGPHEIIRKGLIKISNIPKFAAREMHRTRVPDDSRSNHDKMNVKDGDWSTTSSESLDRKGQKVVKRPRTVIRPRYSNENLTFD